MNKIKLFTIVGVVFLFFTTILTIFEIYRTTSENETHINLKNEQIIRATNSFLEYLKSDTSKKIDILLEDEKITKAFLEQNRESLYNYTQEYYKREIKLNPYFKIMTFRLLNGSTFLRVHKPQMYGDKLNKKRKIILDTNKLKKRLYGFEIGKLKMTYRVVTPVFYKNKHIGLVEIGIEPEYLIDKLNKTFDHLNSGLIVKKDMLNVFSEKIKEKKVVGEKYILARGDEIFDKNHKLLCPTSNIVLTHNNHDYIVSSNLNLYDHKNNIAAKLLFSYEIQSMKDRLYNTILLTISIIFILMIALFIIINIVFNKFANIIEEQKNEIQTILDASSGIIVVSDGSNIINANQSFFNFFENYKTLEEFKKDYDCICDRFEEVQQDDYICGKTIDNTNWVEYILNNKNSTFKAMMKNNNHEEYHFLINLKEVILNSNNYIVVELSDITNELKHQKELEYKQKLLLEQSKHAAMGEMIGNIAHQWRQPLTIISTSTSGMQIQSELGMLDEKMIQENCEMIDRNTQFLSKTLDNFRDFIKGSSSKKSFDLKNAINNFLHLIEGSIKSNEINIILDLENDIELISYENELTQAFMNIYNNSKDAFIKNNIKNRYLFFTTKIKNNKIQITIKDNAGGINENILSKVFEPYFTTKHQSQGTGLGLHMTYNLIAEAMEGSIEVNNTTYIYEEQKYTGAIFKIKLPIG